MDNVKRRYALAIGCLFIVTCDSLLLGKDEKKPAPRALLQKAQTALRAVKTVKYDISIEAEGWIAPFVPALTGRVMIGPKAEYDVGRFVAKVAMGAADSDAKNEFTIGCDGDQYFLIDTQAKTVYHDMDAGVLGSKGSRARQAVIEDFSSKDPLADELKAESLEYVGTETVGGELCHVVKAKWGDGRDSAIFLSVRDGLLRQRDQAFKNPAGAVGKLREILTNIEVNPKIPWETFKVVVPAGFTSTNDFAP